MVPALSVRQRLLRRLGGAVGLVTALGLVACGGPAEPGLAPSSSSATPSAPATSGPTSPPADVTSASPSADRVVIDITIADGRVSPNGDKLDVAVGQQVALNVTSDIDDEIHAHTDDADGYQLEVSAGVPASGSFTVSAPGSFEVESHELGKTIVILNVR
jgi:hypothetical protein